MNWAGSRLKQRDETYIIGLPVDREILVHVQVKTFYQQSDIILK